MEETQALLQAVVRGSEMGKNTLTQLLPAAGAPALRAELLRQRRAYRVLNQQAHTALAALGCRAKGLGWHARAVTRLGIAAQLRRDASDCRLARMLIRGGALGLSDCRGALRACPSAAAGARLLAHRLCCIEQQGAARLRAFL